MTARLLKRVRIDNEWYKVVAVLSWDELNSSSCVFALRSEADASLVFLNGGAPHKGSSNVWVPGSPAVGRIWEQAELMPEMLMEFVEEEVKGE